MVGLCSMHIARTWILIESLVISLIRTFISIVSFPERERLLSFPIFLLHLIRAEFDVITCVNDRPLHTNVVIMEIWVGTIFETGFMEGRLFVDSLFSSFGSTVPCFVGCHKLLLDDWSCVCSLRAVSINENVTHFT